MFDEVTKSEGGSRATRRVRYVILSTLVQIGMVVMVTVSAATNRKVGEGPIVPVVVVRSLAPPPAAPPPPAPKKVAPTPKVEPPKAQAMLQPKEVAEEFKPPDPDEEPEESSGEGVEGGVIGGVVGGALAPAPVRFNSTMAPPVFVSGPELRYTQQALEREIEGVMVVECVVDVEGRVHGCRVLRSVPFMDRAVVENLERRRYKPAALGGKPLDVQYTFTIRLVLPQ